MNKVLRSALPAALLLAANFVLAQGDLDDKDRKALREKAAATLDSTKIWTKGGIFQLNFTQVQLVNWSAGGLSSLSGIAQVNAFANKRKDKIAWDNSLAIAYGLLAQEGKRSFKSDDRFELNSRYGYQIGSSAWYASAMLQFRSQFTEGFNATNDTVKISNLLAPGYLLFGLGADYKPNDKFSLYISPATVKMTFVMDQDLADAGAFGVDPAVYELDSLGLPGRRTTPGETSLFQFGAFLNATYQTPVAKNISFMTRLDLFSNYLKDPSNIDVNWEMLWTFKVNDWFAATLNTMLIYDHDIDIARVEDNTPKFGPTTQFRETLGVGLNFKF